MDTEKDASAGFRLTRRTADHDARDADLDNTELAWKDVVAIETASRLESPARMQAVVRRVHIDEAMVEELDQPILSAEAERTLLVERGAGNPLCVCEQGGSDGLLPCQGCVGFKRRGTGPVVRQTQGASLYAGDLEDALAAAREQDCNRGRKSGQFGRE